MDNHRVTASSETLMQQAGWTAAEYMRAAVEKIDFEFGKGFAKSHPELVGQFIMACAIDFQAGIVARALETVATQIEDLSCAVGELTPGEPT